MVSDCDRTLADLGDSGPHRFRVRGYEVDLRAERLSDPNGREVPLRPQSFAVLRHLLLSDGRLVGRDELMFSVWGKVVVTDDSLVQAICDVRRALGDNGHELIRTVRGRGYCLPRGMVIVASDNDARVVHMADEPFRLRTLIGRLGVPMLCAFLVLVSVLASRSRWLSGGDVPLGGGGSMPVIAFVPIGEIRANDEGGSYVVYGKVGLSEEILHSSLHVNAGTSTLPVQSTSIRGDAH